MLGGAPQEDINPFVNGKPFLQRSMSAPAIAEHVSEASLPYNYEQDVDISSSMLYQYGNNPSRLNPRMPASSKSSKPGELEETYSTLLDEPSTAALSTGILSLSIGDAKLSRTPMDLIQADFPSTPSAVYSNRITNFDKEMNENEIKTDDQTLNSPRAGANSSNGSNVNGVNSPTDILSSTASISLLSANASAHIPVDKSLESKPTNSFQHLYSSSEISNVSTTTVTGNVPANMPSSTRSTSAAAVFFPSTTPNPANINPPILPNTLNNGDSILSLPVGNQNSSLLSQKEKGSTIFRNMMPNNNNTYTGTDHTAIMTTQANPTIASYNGLAMNNSNTMLNHGINTLAPNMGTSTLNLNGVANNMNQSNVMQQHQNQQQPAYFVQQAVYVDQNGQPIYYRPAPNAGQYAQEYVYSTAPDGTPIMSVGADQMQGNFIPYSSQMQGMGQTMSSPYWPDQSQMQAGGAMSMYMNANGQPQAMGAMSTMDNARRMVYNPATGQYNSIVTANSGLVPTQMSGQGNRGIPMNGQMVNAAGVYGMGSNMITGMMQSNNMSLPSLLPRSQVPMQGIGSDGMFHGNMHDDMNLRNNMRDDMDYNRGGGGGGRDGNYRNDRDNRMNDRGGNRNDRNGRNGSSNNRDNISSNNSQSGVNPVRDSLVEEFRNTYGKSRQWGLRDLLGHVVAFCQDQHGSRFIQQRLEVCSDVDKQLIFDEIIPSAQSLMTDVFGNYVLQKLFEYGTADQCEALALLLKGQSVQLAMQMYGCRVVQKALEYVNTPRLIELVAEFESPPLLLRCVHDSNGNHVIQKCIEIVSKVAKEAATPEMSDYLSSRIQFIIAAFNGKVKELSSHPYGCRVVQRILEHCSNNQKSVVLEELRQCCTELVQDCYGNYVIQFVMQHGWEADRAVLIREVQTNLLDFSQHKFASNVVEKCLQYANKKDRDEMIWTIINVTFDLKNPVDAKGHCVLESMVRDPYANYVVQKVIDVSDERQRAAIMRYVKENITQLRRYTYGKHIIVRLEKITNEKF